ncbi:hypothetical protein [uncultured Paraglaciecola sp.]|uniref:hypothetical protein n=1 Tax=uncultured Paraglaciecola sp. TaxID=1765024 RepID=UPI002628C42D|nr:hypothetical protein [uncultured Paraglaciecola sp.]
MANVLITNNAYSTLASSITDVDTSITVATGEGARFPLPSGGDYFYVTLIDTSNNLEVVKCTARSSDALTVTRGEDNTTARAYSAADRIELRPTAAMLEDIRDAEATPTDASVTTAKVADSNVTLAKLADIADERVLGNVSGGTAAPSALTGAQVAPLLAAFVGDSGSGGTKGVVPAPAANDADTGKIKQLAADGTWRRSGWEFVEMVTGTGSTLTSTAAIETYDEIRLTFWVKPSSTDTLIFEAANAGPVWLTTANDYWYYFALFYINKSGGGFSTQASNGSTTATNINFSNGTLDVYHTTVAAGAHGVITLPRLGDSSVNTLVNVESLAFEDDAFIAKVHQSSAMINDASAITDIRLRFSGGSNFTTGSNILIEGRMHS